MNKKLNKSFIIGIALGLCAAIVAISLLVKNDDSKAKENNQYMGHWQKLGMKNNATIMEIKYADNNAISIINTFDSQGNHLKVNESADIYIDDNNQWSINNNPLSISHQNGTLRLQIGNETYEKIEYTDIGTIIDNIKISINNTEEKKQKCMEIATQYENVQQQGGTFDFGKLDKLEAKEGQCTNDPFNDDTKRGVDGKFRP